MALLETSAWGYEPESPAALDRAQFTRALSELCTNLSPERAGQYAQWIEDSAHAHGEDPFLLAAVMHRMSSCRSDANTSQGIGLTAIQPAMLSDNADGRVLRYAVQDGSNWRAREKTLNRPLSEATLRDAQTNLEWAAALMAMWREQHGTVDAHFEQQFHRHYISHFFWGDSIESDREEDRIFTDRRRLLSYYGVRTPEATQDFRGVAFGSPLEASPRVVSSAPGASRDAGLRRHRGVDVEAVMGEPVLAMADGTVFFAGVDMPGQGARALEPKEMKRVAKRRMGRGGRFICIDHAAAGPDEAFLRSCYMHLEDVDVKNGDVVRRGERIGTVGRTGVKHSPPHLHLEIKSDRRFYDARNVVPKILIGAPPPEPKRKRRVPRV